MYMVYIRTCRPTLLWICVSSSGFYDELGWAALWLYKATAIPQYLIDAEALYKHIAGIPWAFSWDEKHVGVQVTLFYT